MSRVSDTFERLNGRSALIAYVMAGYPQISDTPSIVRGLVRGGVDIIELGLPFSDPIADGPVIQDAATRSLANGVNVPTFLDIIRKVRAESDIPLVLMTYSNILYRYGYEKFIADSSAAGIDGYILPDMPMEESAHYTAAAHKNNSDAIFLVSPNTREERIREITKITSGFLYLVAVYGTTGASGGPQDYSVAAVGRIKDITGDRIPLGVGFGVSSSDDIKMYVNAGADAVIVGSAILRLISKTPRDALEETMAQFAAGLKGAMIS